MDALDFKLLIELGALLVAILVAWTGLRAGKAAEKSAEAQLDAVHASVIGQAIDDYQRMGRDMSDLIDWHRACVEQGADFVEVYRKDRDGVDHISGCRRNVRLYFQKCAMLSRSGAITDKVFHTIAHKKGLNTLHRIVIPLENLKLNNDRSFFDENPEMTIYQNEPYVQHGDGLFTYERLGR